MFLFSLSCTLTLVVGMALFAARQSRAAVSPARNESPRPLAQDPDYRAKVLVLESHADLRRIISLSLKRDYDVITVSSAAQAKILLPTMKPDLILCDVELPDADGRSLCRRHKQHTGTADTPFVLMSVRPENAMRISCMDAGADEFLLKPFHLTQLHECVAAHIRGRHHLLSYFQTSAQ